jgi:hypothetical protein
MTDDVRKLEHEVEIARSRLRSDLSVLSSPRTYAALKEDLKSEANSKVNDLIDRLKARAAANPAAALAIGAGIAWRVIERPPIAAALIGAGLFSLFRTTPVKSSPFQQRDYFAEGRQRLTEQVSDFAEDLRDEAADMARSAASHAGNAAGAAAEKVRDFASAATAQAQERASSASHLASQAINDATELAGELPARAGRMIQKASLVAEDAISDSDTRDKLLLGTAGLAVATVLGIAFQRAMSSTERNHP